MVSVLASIVSCLLDLCWGRIPWGGVCAVINIFTSSWLGNKEREEGARVSILLPKHANNCEFASQEPTARRSISFQQSLSLALKPLAYGPFRTVCDPNCKNYCKRDCEQNRHKPDSGLKSISCKNRNKVSR